MKKTLLFLILFCSAVEMRAQSSGDKNPGIAFALSAFVPGSGIIYNDQVIPGLIVFTAEAALITGAAFAYNDYLNAKTAADRRTIYNYFIGLSTAAATIHILQLYYSPLGVKYSKNNGKSAGRSTRLEPALTSRGLGLQLKF